MRTFNFLRLSLVTAALGLLAGCSQEVSQSDVNKKAEAANQAVADANAKTDEIRHEAGKEITAVDQARIDKTAKLQAEINTKPAADGPKLAAEIDQTNRDAVKQATEIRDKAATKQDAVVAKANQKTTQAEQIAANYAAQKDQQAYVEARESDLMKYDPSIAELRKRRDGLAGDAKTRFDQKLTVLDDKRSEAGKALANLKSAKPEEWTTFQDEVVKAFTGLKIAYDAAGVQPGA